MHERTLQTPIGMPLCRRPELQDEIWTARGLGLAITMRTRKLPREGVDSRVESRPVEHG